MRLWWRMRARTCSPGVTALAGVILCGGGEFVFGFGAEVMSQRRQVRVSGIGGSSVMWSGVAAPDEQESRGESDDGIEAEH